MKTRVIINPSSRGGRVGKEWPRHAAALQAALGPFETLFTAQAGGAWPLAFEAARTSARIIAVGGDGTVNEVINGLAQAAGQKPIAAELGFIGVGTGNDFIRTLGIKSGWAGGIAALQDGKPRGVELGLVHYTTLDGTPASRWFANAINIGLFGQVVADVQQSKLKRFLGSGLIYPLHAGRLLFSYPGHHIAYEHPEGGREQKIAVVTVANGRYIGGGFMIAPHAALDDGLLDVTVIEKVRAHDLYRIRAGAHLKLPAYSTFKTARTRFETIDGSAMICDADGEPLGQAPCTFEVVKDKLRVIAP